MDNEYSNSYSLSIMFSLIQSVRTVLSCMTLLTIAVCLLAHVGIVHSDHTPLLTVKQVCILVLQSLILIVSKYMH